jgi:hypothetical protein
MVIILFWPSGPSDPGHRYKNGKTTPLTLFNQVVLMNIPKNRQILYMTSPEPLETTIAYLVEYYYG